MIKMEQILIISPEQWRWQYVSKHHYAITLARLGYKVYFLNPPSSTLSQIEILETKYANLYEVNSSPVARGLRFYPKILQNFLEKKWLTKLETNIGNKFTIIWLFENSRFYDMDFASKCLKIYHQVDLNQEFHIEKAATSADICFCTTDFIKKKLLPYNEVYKIHHGVTFQKEKNSLSVKDKKIFIGNHINVVLVGNLDISFLDVNLLVSLVETFPEVLFNFVGSYDKNQKLFKACIGFKNIVWWGRVDSYLIPSILLECEIQLLVYKAENEYDKEQLASPHKLMEYFSSGKVTIATYTDEYKDKRHLLEMVDTSSDYIERFAKVINNLKFYNSKDKELERIAFAKTNSYEKQLEKIFLLLNKNQVEL